MILETMIGRWRRGQTTNAVTTSFSALLDTLTKPAASATRTVIDCAGGSSNRKERSVLRLVPFGGDTNDQTFSLKVVGWNRVLPAIVGETFQWHPSAVCEVSATLSSTLLGLAGAPVVATEFYADALSVVTGDVVLHTGTVNVDPAWLECDVSIFELVEVVYDLTGAVGANALYSF
jgi:hypothetical protein